MVSELGSALCASTKKEKWARNEPVMVVSLSLPRRCDAQNGTWILSKKMLLIPLILMTMVWMRVECVSESRSPFNKIP